MNSVFYYPYASFYDDKAKMLLRAAAFYFDQLNVLDPLKAISGRVTVEEDLARETSILEREGVLRRIAPEEVLHTQEQNIARAVAEDMGDKRFLDLCSAQTNREFWTVALAKVPKAIRSDPRYQPLDRSMQRVMGELPREVAGEIVRYDERYAEVMANPSVYDEVGSPQGEPIEYRFADYPLALGESIMINHALYGGLVHAEATPITTDPFHHEILRLKIERTLQDPSIRQVLEDRAQSLAQDASAMATLTDKQLELPAMRPGVPLEEVLELRARHAPELERARKDLGWMARRIAEEPWTREFDQTVSRQLIPNVADGLVEVEKSLRAAKGAQGNVLLDGTSTAVGAATTVLPLLFAATPLMPLAVFTAVLGLLGGPGINGIRLFRRWRDGEKDATGNGLQYLLRVPE